MNIYGASGHAKVIIECIEASNIPIYGIYDDDFNKSHILNYSISHNIGTLSGPFVIAIGENSIRKKIVLTSNFTFGKVIHPTAIISKRALIGGGTVVMHNAVIQSDAMIGDHCIVNTSATIDHDCEIGDFVHVAPGVTICGNVKIGECTLIGAGSVILPNINIGANCVIGAGSVIINDIPDNVIVTGSPGKIKN